MNSVRSTLAIAVLLIAFAGVSVGGDLDTIGWTALTAREPALNGSGLTLGQVEAGADWQPSPAVANQPASMFTYFDSANPYASGGASFDSDLESGHANTVANNYFDASTGTARSPDAVEAFSADYF